MSEKARTPKKAAAVRQPQHPTVQIALAGLEKGTQEPYAFSGDGRARLLAALKAMARSPDFKPVIAQLVAFAAFLDEKKRSPQAARDLLEVLVASAPALFKPVPKTRAGGR